MGDGVGASDDGATGRVGSTDEGGGARSPAPPRPAAVRPAAVCPLSCEMILPAPCQCWKECFGSRTGMMRPRNAAMDEDQTGACVR